MEARRWNKAGEKKTKRRDAPRRASGRYAAKRRFVNALTGQATAPVPAGVVTVS